MILTYAAVVGASYLIGSFPTAYLLVKWKAHLDIRQMGSGNVGALNSYEVTRSRSVCVIVLLVDLLKGALAVLLTRFFLESSLLYEGLAATGVVLGHNYPVWLGFRGGRGLASAAGAMLLVSWVFVFSWGLVWTIVYYFTKNIHKGNIGATLVTPFVAASLVPWMVARELLRKEDIEIFMLFVFVICTLLFLRHLGPLRELFFRKSS